jgi:hypothetical protein
MKVQDMTQRYRKFKRAWGMAQIVKLAVQPAMA